MKIKNFNNFFKVFLLIAVLSLTACNLFKGKEKAQQANTADTRVEDTYPTYSELYVDRVAFNSVGDLVAIFSAEISKEQNLKEKIYIEPEVTNLEIDSYGNKIVLKGNFEKEVPYSVSFDEDLKDVNGNKLGSYYADFSNLYIGKKQPNLRFPDKASTLSSLNNKKINFTSTNIKKVKLEVVKIYMNNITGFLKNKEQRYYYGAPIKEDLGDVVFSKEYVLENITDEEMKNSIDLNGIIDSKGVYRVSIYVDDADDIDYDEDKYGYIQYYEWSDSGRRIYAKADKNIILSDLGLLANSNAEKLEVKAININSLNVMPNTKLEFISKKNQLLEEGYTNANGQYKSKLNPEDVYYILAKNNNEFNVLYLNESMLNYSDFDIGGVVEASDFKIFTYTDKGYYRPGDEISVSLIARNKNQNIENNHPFTYSFTSPTGVEKLNNVTVNESKNGFYNFKIKSDINDETGAWNLKIKFGEKEINESVFIDAKAPNRIAIEMDTTKTYTKEDVQNGKLNVEVSAAYLTGVKASESQTNYEVALFEKDVKTKKYKNYTFINPTSNFMYNTYIEGNLNKDGKENLAIEIPEVAKKFNLDIFVYANVLDTNGRYSTESKLLTLMNHDFAIGLQKVVKENGDIAANFIVLDEKTDSLIKGKTVKYRLFNKKYNWWYDSYDSDENYIKNSLDTIIISEGTYTSQDTPYTIELKNLEEGINFLELVDEETGVSSGIFIYNYSYGDAAKNGMENLNISSDKEKYEVGEVANIKFNGTEGAKALISIEKDGKILKEYWKDLTQKNNEEKIVVEKDYFPNAYVNVSVFQKYKDKENDRPLRLYGSVPLMVNDKTKELNVVIDSKSEVEPSSNYKIKISNKEKQKMYFQYYLVDEGILRQTEYKLPKPYEFFYGKQAKLVKNYDNFSDIIEKYSSSRISNYLKTGGGDFEEAALAKAAYLSENMNLQGKAERFKNISIVSEILETDENGNAEVNIKIPNYFGAMKIFVVATNNDKFGSAEKALTVKAPVIVESSAPRVLKVGDKFSIPITLFPMEDNLGKGKITVKYEGKEFSKDVNLSNKDKQKFEFDLVAPQTVGQTKIEVNYASEKYNFKDTIDLNVDSPYPQQYISKNTVLKAGQEFKINANEFKDFINSSLNSELKVSSYENLGLNKVINSLLDYPYICLEQTSSKGRAMLAINSLTDDVNQLNSAKNSLNTIIKKLSNNYQLSNGGFTYWPGNNYEDYGMSIYTIEFLVDAKRQGYYVPEQMYDRAINYLKSLINRTDVATESKTRVLYILASIGQPNISEMNIIFDRYYKELPTLSKWVLLDAYGYIGEKDFAKREANKLARNTETTNGYYAVYQNAEILKHYISIYGERDKELFDNLLSVVKADTWLQTYSQASIVDALSKAIPAVERKNLAFNISVNGEAKNYTLENGQFNFQEINKAIKENKVVTIKNTSNDNLYIDLLVKGKPIKFTEKDLSKNIVLTRTFKDINGNNIDPKKLKVGDRVSLFINVEVKNLDYLPNIALVQIVPSGWEIAEVPMYYNYDYIDKRDDRVALFFGQSSSSKQDYRIDFNVVSKGEYFFPGTSAEAMYDDNFRAYLKGFDVKVID